VGAVGAVDTAPVHRSHWGWQRRVGGGTVIRFSNFYFLRKLCLNEWNFFKILRTLNFHFYLISLLFSANMPKWQWTEWVAPLVAQAWHARSWPFFCLRATKMDQIIRVTILGRVVGDARPCFLSVWGVSRAVIRTWRTRWSPISRHQARHFYLYLLNFWSCCGPSSISINCMCSVWAYPTEPGQVKLELKTITCVHGVASLRSSAMSVISL
jgi:hypothetical protein